MSSNKIKISEIIHPIYSTIRPLKEDENLRPMEMNEYKISKLPNFVRITPPSISMKTVDFKMRFDPPYTNINNCEIFKMFAVSPEIMTIETKINNTPAYKTIDPKFIINKGVLGSQVTFHIDNFKIKLFNVSNGICVVQIPGVINIDVVKKSIKVLRDKLNEMFKAPIVSEEFDYDLKGFSAKCILQIPLNMSINFEELYKALNEVRDLQLNPETDDPVSKRIWPICNVDGTIIRKKCYFCVYTPIFGCEYMQKVRVDIYSKEKKIDNNTANFSIIIYGRCQSRQLRYVYHLLWEIFIKYESKIIYNEQNYIQDLKTNELQADLARIKLLEDNLNIENYVSKTKIFDI